MLAAYISTASAATRVPYEWSNLPVGGNGFITGITFHPKEENLIYIRTDVGGCYRWDPENESWIQLMDGFGYEDKNLYGIDGLAVDPNNPDILYVSAGAWTWDDGDVLKSTDRGETWEKTGLNKAFYGNGGERGWGENIAVDPNNSSIIYVGTPQDGLWRSTDSALSWSQVEAVECTTADDNKIRGVIFDPASGEGGKSQTIYISVKNKGIYRTIDGGDTWELMEGSPLRTKRMAVGCNGTLFAASESGLWRYRDDTWTEISDEDHQGKTHSGVAVDPENEDIIYVLGYSSDTMKIPMLMTTDGGETWINKRETADYQTMLPWDKADSFSANTHDIKINPFNTKEIWITDWFAPYRTKDITAEPTQKWENLVQGIEETVPRDAITPEDSKYRVITGVADVDGFVYENLTEYPERQLRLERDQPWMMTTTQLDFCEEDQDIIVRCGVDWNVNGKMEYSLDGTETWINITNVPYYYDAEGNKLNAVPFGRLAVSAQKHPDTGLPVVVAVPAYAPTADKQLAPGTNTLPLVSFDLGETWQEVSGLPEGINIMDDYWDKYTPIASDRVNGSKFYLYGNNQVFVSNDWGVTWEATVQLNADINRVSIRAVPYMEDHVWLCLGDNGLCYSTDGGRSFEYISAVSKCVGFGFGKAAEGFDNPAAYVYGEIDGVMGMYRSGDMGSTWVRINDDDNKLGLTEFIIVGDRKEYGVVYVGTGGRSFYVGQPMGASEPTVTEPEKELTISCNGEVLDIASDAVYADDILMVSARSLLEGCGFKVDWHQDELAVTADRNIASVDRLYGLSFEVSEGSQSLRFMPGSAEATVNGETKQLETSPIWVGDRVFVPLEEFAGLIGATVKKDDTGLIIRIYDNVYLR